MPSLAYMLYFCKLVALENDEEDNLLYFFMSLAGLTQEWPHRHPVIVIDKTFIKANFRGTLLSVCAIKANEQIFPLVFGVGPLESIDSRKFFFTKLKKAIRDRDDLIIISNRYEGIQNIVKKVYPNAYHGFCIQHLARNMKSN